MRLELLPPEVILWVVRCVLGTSFALSGAAKLRDLPGFVRGAEDYQVLPRPIVQILASALPFIELMLGAALIIDIAPRSAALGAIVLLSIFAAVVLINLVRGRRIPCFCSGAASRQIIGWATVARIFALLVAACLVAAGQKAATVTRPQDATTASVWVLQLSLVFSCLVALAMLGPIEVTMGSLRQARRLRRLRPPSKTLDSVAAVRQHG